MIVTRTPFRITLGGGGTDLPSFYERHGGFILAMGLDKYMYVLLNRPSVGKRITLHYTQSESVEQLDDLRHELAREALRACGIRDSIEISSLADIPASTGLGSSSAYLVGLLTALHAFSKTQSPPQALAEEACRIELEVLKKRIGKQDQFMAAFGGMTVLDISKSGEVKARQLSLRSWALSELVAKTHIYYLKKTRDALEVLQDQDRAMREKTPDSARVEESLLSILDIGRKVLKAVETEDFDQFGRLMDEHWLNKKKLSNKISFDEADRLYDLVKKEYGVLGGKIVGAGGGGFLMLYCPSKGKELNAFMHSKGYLRLPYGIEFEGAKIAADLQSSSELG